MRRLRTIPSEYACPNCVRHVDEFPHRCPTHTVACTDCDLVMGGYARQILDAAEAHSRACPGVLRPLRADTRGSAA